MVLDKYFRFTGQRGSLQPVRYVVNEVVKLSSQQQVNAQGKAREDVLHTVRELGFKTYNITNHKYVYQEGLRPHHYPYLSKWLANRQGKKFVRQVKAGDIIFIQDFYLGYMQNIATACMQRGAKVIFLVHDVQCIRFNKHTSEVKQLNNASLLLVHTQAMKDKLTELGVKTPMRIIQLFDYYSSATMATIEEIIRHKNDVVFAGNLSKSEFLKDLFDDDTNKLTRFQLYGIKGELNLGGRTNIDYNGIFTPNDTSTICGGWGLVWDGYNIYACTGDYGNYLRYNSSHKLSLYLTCGLPVIVWENSSLAKWVKDEKIGIVVSTLKHLDEQIANVSDEDYRQMVNNAHQIGLKLREGFFLKQHLKEL